MQANYWWGQMHCGPPNQNLGWAMAHPAHPAAPSPPMAGVEKIQFEDSIRTQEVDSQLPSYKSTTSRERTNYAYITRWIMYISPNYVENYVHA